MVKPIIRKILASCVNHLENVSGRCSFPSRLTSAVLLYFRADCFLFLLKSKDYTPREVTIYFCNFVKEDFCLLLHKYYSLGVRSFLKFKPLCANHFENVSRRLF